MVTYCEKTTALKSPSRASSRIWSRTSILPESELTGRRRSHRKARPRKRQSDGFFDDLNVGDFVVHHQHGVGKFGGMVKRAIGGHERDYLLLEYRGNDKLYLPSDQIDLIRRYTGGESPSLHRLGGSDFAKAKELGNEPE